MTKDNKEQKETPKLKPCGRCGGTGVVPHPNEARNTTCGACYGSKYERS